MGSVVGREDPRALAPSSELEGPPGLGSVTQSTDRPERVEPDVDQGLEDTLDWKHDKEGDTEPFQMSSRSSCRIGSLFQAGPEDSQKPVGMWFKEVGFSST